MILIGIDPSFLHCGVSYIDLENKTVGGFELRHKMGKEYGISAAEISLTLIQKLSPLTILHDKTEFYIETPIQCNSATSKQLNCLFGSILGTIYKHYETADITINLQRPNILEDYRGKYNQYNKKEGHKKGSIYAAAYLIGYSKYTLSDLYYYDIDKDDDGILSLSYSDGIAEAYLHIVNGSSYCDNLRIYGMNNRSTVIAHVNT